MFNFRKKNKLPLWSRSDCPRARSDLLLHQRGCFSSSGYSITGVKYWVTPISLLTTEDMKDGSVGPRNIGGFCFLHLDSKDIKSDFLSLPCESCLAFRMHNMLHQFALGTWNLNLNTKPYMKHGGSQKDALACLYWWSRHPQGQSAFIVMTRLS